MLGSHLANECNNLCQVGRLPYKDDVSSIYQAFPRATDEPSCLNKPCHSTGSRETTGQSTFMMVPTYGQLMS